MSSADDGWCVVVDQLSRVFDGPPRTIALQPCSFRIRRGEFVALTGASGSGKTTLLSLLGLLDQPTEGRYLLDGRDVAALSDSERAAVRAHRIGFVFQAFHLVPYRTVLDNVELGLTYQGVRRSERRLLAADMVDQVGLSSRRNVLCRHLSGGEKQRVAIARTLIRQPAFVLCDEPTGNLDTQNSAQVLEQIEALNASGLTVMIVTHDATIAARARRHLTISDGAVAEATS